MKKNIFKWLSIFFMAAVCIGFASCGDDDEDDTPKPEAPTATGNIHGLVTDYNNANAPIAGATVTLNVKGLTKTTGSDGRYEFTNIEPGTYTIQVMASNYRTTTKQVTVYADQQALCDFQLRESAVTIYPIALHYGKDVNEMSFTITNNSANLQNFSIDNIPSYLTLSATSGVITSRGNKVIIATLNSRPQETRHGKMLVTVGSEDYEINITVVGSNARSDEEEEEGDEGGGASPSTGDVTRGLLCYYNFDDGTAKNAKDGTNNGVLNGTMSSYITDTPNGRGQALSLAEKEYVAIRNNVLGEARAFSVSLWAKDFSSGTLFINKMPGDYAEGSPRILIDSDMKFQASAANEYELFDWSANSYASSGWHMITVTFANKKDDLYIDGLWVSGVSSRDTRAKGTDGMTIGGCAKAKDRESSFGYRLWNSAMKVDNVRIYNVQLTEDEVAKLYQYEKN